MQGAKSGNLEVVKLLIAKGSNIHDQDNVCDTAVLMTFCIHIIYIMSNAQMETQDGETVLMRATKAGKIEMVRLLVEMGADVKAKSKVQWWHLLCCCCVS